MRRPLKLIAFAAVATAAVVAVEVSSAQPPDPGWHGAPHCIVPDVTGLQLRPAKRRLVAALCRPGFITRRRSSVPKGRVYLQLPDAGTNCGRRTQIDLFVSKGPG
jgi:PASTA domain